MRLQFILLAVMVSASTTADQLAPTNAPAEAGASSKFRSAEDGSRWQFWNRFSVVGFAGTGVAWNDFERIDSTQTIVTGGTGFRYELARKYGIHMGLDVAFGPDNTAVYVQVGSAWARP